ncbi:unnamed protein product [Callosobruchus maculatus]|uniref:Uncharacterized protein n=1 Tax=Callosobruchus maculatus TaxID=64391 RepID=A0A653DB68_CALMS|nr:unnamed protein product [Callosobruchus maculatus]
MASHYIQTMFYSIFKRLTLISSHWNTNILEISPNYVFRVLSCSNR